MIALLTLAVRVRNWPAATPEVLLGFIEQMGIDFSFEFGVAGAAKAPGNLCHAQRVEELAEHCLFPLPFPLASPGERR